MRLPRSHSVAETPADHRVRRDAKQTQCQHYIRQRAGDAGSRRHWNRSVDTCCRRSPGSGFEFRQPKKNLHALKNAGGCHSRKEFSRAVVVIATTRCCPSRAEERSYLAAFLNFNPEFNFAMATRNARTFGALGQSCYPALRESFIVS